MAVIAEKIVELYLNEEWSDVRIIIDGEDLPVHRIVLVQRCPFFKNMFKSSFSESISNRIELKETPVNGFKAILKWIYTGEIKFELIDDALDVLRLAHMYEIAELVNLVILYLKGKIVYDNAIVVLNTSVLLSLDELTDYVSDVIAECPIPLLNHDTFEQLSIDALNVILSDSVPHVSDINIFRAVVRWMKANPSKSAHFPDVIKNVPLKDIRFGEFTAVSDVLDANVLMKATVEQDTEVLPRRKLRDQNVALPKYGVNVVAGGGTSFFSSPCAGEVLRHTSAEGIIVDLGHCFKLNSFKIQLVKTGRRNFSYWIDVSEDNVNWTRVIDHSNYICRGIQKLYFKTRSVRYIRICGTSPNDGAFEISSFKAFYTTEPFEIDSETALLIPFNNVALAKKNAITIQGSNEDALIDGTFEGYTNRHGFTYTKLGKGIIVQLPQPYMLDSMKLLLYDKDNRIYSYNIEVSVDQVKWTRVFSEAKVASWRRVHFDRQPVVFVKITGTYNSTPAALCVVHLECYASKVGNASVK